MRNVKPASVKKLMAIDPLAAEKRGLRNSLTSSIGRARRRSTPTNTASSASPMVTVAAVSLDPQPQLGASMIEKTRVPIAALDSTRPAQSIGGVEGSFDVGTTSATPIATNAATGT